MAASTGEDTQTFYNFKNFADFLKVCSANILVLTGLQHQYIGAVQGESNVCSTTPILLNVAYAYKYAEVEIELFQDGGQIKNKKNINHHNRS